MKKSDKQSALIQSLFLFPIYSKSISVPPDGLIKTRLRLWYSLNRFYRKRELKIYIAGKISGDKNYKKKFKKAERALKKKGHSVMNPAWLVEYKAFSWIDYMIVSEAMQRRCEAVLFLPDWKQSDGARIEHNRAKTAEQKILYSLNDLPNFHHKKSF